LERQQTTFKGSSRNNILFFGCSTSSLNFTSSIARGREEYGGKKGKKREKRTFSKPHNLFAAMYRTQVHWDRQLGRLQVQHWVAV